MSDTSRPCSRWSRSVGMSLFDCLSSFLLSASLKTRSVLVHENCHE